MPFAGWWPEHCPRRQMPAVSVLTELMRLVVMLSFLSFLLDMQDIELGMQKSYEIEMVGKSYGW